MTHLTRLEDLIARAPGIDWSIAIRDLSAGRSIYSLNPERTLKTASLAKVFLLAELAARLADGTLPASEMIDRRSVPPVADSGLWRYFLQDELPLADAAALVGAVSDNWATNALLHRIGLDAVKARSEALGYPESRLEDHVRDHRGPGDPPAVSRGRAGDWADLFARLHTRELVSPQADAHVLDWLGGGVDHSMAASAFHFDTLVHGSEHDGVRLFNKTGTDAGVRADAGLVIGSKALSWCLIANWDPAAGRLDAVFDIMRAAGALIRAEAA